ncbi:MAG: alanine racemase, partial [Actinobacteria bacterium]|nr:alanine racemase [Actinomycetota bacterium]
MKINLSKVGQNCTIINDRCILKGISVVGVSKCFLGDPIIADVFINSGIKILGDSRIYNLKRLRLHYGAEMQLCMLRTPMLSEVSETVDICNISMNTQRQTVKAISGECLKNSIEHKVIIMVETDDRREGLLPDEVKDFCSYILDNCPGVKIWGIGTNARCISEKSPLPQSLGLLIEIKKDIEADLGIKIPIVSGGNSSIYSLIENNLLPEGINQARIGEAILLGHETAGYERIIGTFDDAFTLEAEIIEVKAKHTKISAGHIRDANKIEEQRMSCKAIAALGIQDVNFKN